VVLGTLVIAAILAYVLMSIISNQSRFTYHQTSRIQAYYAAQAGMNYALERLRTNAWTAGSNCTNTTPCSLTDSQFPPAIQNVRIILRPAGSADCLTPPGNSTCVETTANYTYTPP